MLTQMINLRQQQEEFEKDYLSPVAVKSSESRGRAVYEDQCVIRTEFQRDRDRIIHSKAFRRLKHKTQVFIAPVGDHYRTRMTHTLEVSQIARTIARALKLNEDLTEAIAMGHDLGHTPFGHAGEYVLNKLLPGGFSHNEQSERTVTIIENLNLTIETLDGIKNHTGDSKPFTLEGQIVKLADRIAYLNHDIDDAIRAGILNLSDMPETAINTLGQTCSERIAVMVCSTVKASSESDSIKIDAEIQQAMDELRNWMFANIYTGTKSRQKDLEKTERVITELYNYYVNNPHLLADYYKTSGQNPERAAADYIAGMTDRFALQQYQSLFLPQPLYLKFEV